MTDMLKRAAMREERKVMVENKGIVAITSLSSDHHHLKSGCRMSLSKYVALLNSPSISRRSRQITF